MAITDMMWREVRNLVWYRAQVDQYHIDRIRTGVLTKTHRAAYDAVFFVLNDSLVSMIEMINHKVRDEQVRPN